MKKIMVGGLALLTSFSLVGCGGKEVVEVNLESYYFKDTKNGENIEEYIEVSLEDNEVSKYTIKDILKNMENKEIGTNIKVQNMQGVQIATLKETDGKSTINIDKEYKSNKKANISLMDSEDFKQIAELQRDIVEETIFDNVNYLMEIFESINDEFEGELTQELLRGIAAGCRNSRPREEFDLTQIINKSKIIKDNEQFTKMVDLLVKTNEAFLTSIQESKEYYKDKKQKHLDNLKVSMLDFRECLNEYQEQINSFNEDDTF